VATPPPPIHTRTAARTPMATKTRQKTTPRGSGRHARRCPTAATISVATPSAETARTTLAAW